ncbi:MAG: DUF72 domain-containing protein [bacterium]
MNDKAILVGTSGYSFQDWKGVYYPGDIPDGKMLDHYAREFSTVEINSTYYRIPPAAVFYHMAQKTPDDFEFIVKVHQEVTHKRNSPKPSMDGLREAVRPLEEAQKLYGFLAQFPWGFKYQHSRLGYLKWLADECAPHPVFVEFRHIGWVRDDVYDYMRSNRIGYCCVDEPGLHGLLPPQAISTTELGYLRFHGRNTSTWWNSSRGDRYDYQYSTEELQEWLERIRKIRQNTDKVYLFFNNCHLGQAVTNAQQMQKILMENKLF